MLWNFSSGGGDSLFVLCKIEIGPFSICDARRMHPTALSHTPILSRFLWFQELNYSATFVHVVLQVNAAELCFSWNCWSSSSQRRESRVTQECNSNITPSWRRRDLRPSACAEGEGQAYCWATDMWNLTPSAGLRGCALSRVLKSSSCLLFWISLPLPCCCCCCCCHWWCWWRWCSGVWRCVEVV